MLKTITVKLLNYLSIAVASFLRLFAPLHHKLARLWCLTLFRVKVRNVPNSTQFDGPVHVLGSGNVILGEYCRIGRDVVFETQEAGVIILGNHVRINQGTVLVAYEQISIGNDCLIGEYCSIRDANHGSGLGDLIRKQLHDFSSITINNNCWIGRGCVILKGVNLGRGCIVGANSVVNRDVDEEAIAAGVPAKVIRPR